MTNPPLPSIGSLIDKSWSTLRTHGMKLLVLLAPPYLLLMLAMLVSSFAVINVYQNADATLLKPIQLLVVPFFLVLAYLLYAGICAAISYLLALPTQKLTFAESYRLGFKTALKLFATNLITSSLVFVGSMLFIIPGIILSVYQTFTSFIVVEEGGSGINPLLKARAYIYGRFIATLGRLLLLVLGMFAVIIGASLLAIIPIIGWIAFPVIFIGMMLFLFIYTFHLYQDLKSTKPLPDFVPSNKSTTLMTIAAILGGIFYVGLFLSSLIIGAINPSEKIRQAQMEQYEDFDLQMNETEIPTYAPYPTN